MPASFSFVGCAGSGSIPKDSTAAGKTSSGSTTSPHGAIRKAADYQTIGYISTSAHSLALIASFYGMANNQVYLRMQNSYSASGIGSDYLVDDSYCDSSDPDCIAVVAYNGVPIPGIHCNGSPSGVGDPLPKAMAPDQTTYVSDINSVFSNDGQGNNSHIGWIYQMTDSETFWQSDFSTQIPHTTAAGFSFGLCGTVSASTSWSSPNHPPVDDYHAYSGKSGKMKSTKCFTGGAVLG